MSAKRYIGLQLTGINSTGSTLSKNLFCDYDMATKLITVPSADAKNVGVLLDDIPTGCDGILQMTGICQITAGTGDLSKGDLVKVANDGTGVTSTVNTNLDVAVALEAATAGDLCWIKLR